MKTWLRKLRGILGIGTVWGLASAALGATIGAIGSVIGGEPLIGWVITGGLWVGSIGFLLGSGFGGILSMSELLGSPSEG